MLHELFLFLLLFFLAPADDLSLSGLVLGPNASPIAAAAVTIENSTEGLRWVLETSGAGGFKLERLTLGTYHLVVHKDGFFDAQTDIRLEAGKTIEFTLAPLQQLSEQVDVVARPEPINPDALSTQTTVNSEVIQSLPFSGRRNFLNALALMPGVINDTSGGVHMGGSSSAQVRYQLDGIALNDAASGALAFRIPIDSIESVDLDLAGYSAEFGKGSGGIVRVHSRFMQDKFHWNFTDFIPGINFQRKTIGDFSPRASVSGPLDASKFWFLYSASSRYVPTFKEDLPEGRNRQTQTVLDQLLKLQWNVAEANVLTVNLLHNSQYDGNLGLSPSRPLEVTTNFLRRGVASAISDRAVIGGTVLETLLQWNRSHESDLPKGVLPMELHPEGWGGNFFAERRARDYRVHIAQTVSWERTGRIAHRLKAGMEFDDVGSDLFFERRAFKAFNADGAIESSVSFVGPASTNVGNREYGVFFEDRMVATNRLQVAFGLRADRESIVGRTNAAPRAAFSYLPFGTEHSKISGGIGVFYDNVPLNSIEVPMLARRTTVESGAMPVNVAPDLKNPRGLHWNLSWEQEWAPRWVTRVNAIHKRGRDQVRVASHPQGNGFDLELNNSGSFRYRALELSLDRPVRTNLRFFASYVYSTNRGRPSLSIDFPDPALEMVPESPVDWDVRHRFLSWGYFPFLASTNASFTLEARSGFPYTAVNNLNQTVGTYNSHRLPAYFVANLSFEKEVPTFFRKRMAVRVGILNLFNRFNPRFVDLNVNSPTFMKFSDSSGRAFVARFRLVR